MLPALEELRISLFEIRKVTGDVGMLVEKIHATVERIAVVERNILSLYSFYKKNLTQAAYAGMEGLKAGVKAGIISLLRNLKSKKEESS